MLRRSFVAALPALVLSPYIARAALGASASITEIRNVGLKVERELGRLPSEFMQGMASTYAIGGGAITEIVTDQGAVGIGPGVDAATLASATTMLVGQDPLNIRELAARLQRRGDRAAAALEIALWDLIGKLTGQPLWKLWGGSQGRVKPYASFMTRGTPEACARLAMKVKEQGFTACKLRASFPTMREDIAVVEAVRKVVGSDFQILTDANKAYPGNRFMWDFKRAVDTARAYQDLGVHWLEEPLPRYALDQIAELNGKVEMPIAGGELTDTMFEFRAQLDKRAYDILNCEVAVLGPTAMLKVQTVAEAYGVPVIPHEGFGRLGTICQLHMCAAWGTPLSELIHQPPIADYALLMSIFSEPLPLSRDGHISLPSAAGLGVTIREDLRKG